jgi:hypothetical protein
MIHTTTVKNKVSHIANKIEKRLKVTCDVNILLDCELMDIGMDDFLHKNDSIWWVFELDTINHPYVQNQVKYLNMWLKKYNKRHNTKFTCLKTI